MLRWDDCAPKPWCTKPVAKPLLPQLEKPCNDPGIRHPTTNSRRGKLVGVVGARNSTRGVALTCASRQGLVGCAFWAYSHSYHRG